MTGGIIADNIASQNGGGVYVDSNGTMTVGGTAQITGNYKNDGTTSTANNLYLPDGKTVAVGTSTNGTDGNKVLKLAEGANICVTTQTEPVKGKAVDVTSNGTAADMQYFHSDKTTNSNSETIEVIYEYNDKTDSAKAEVVRLAVPIAQIGSMKYSKVQKAVDSITVTTDTDITLIADSTEDVVITDENVNLKLNGKTLTGSVTVSGGFLDLTEAGTVTGNAAVSGTGKLTVSNGTVTGNVTAEGQSEVTVSSNGTVTGNVTGSENSTVTVSGGTVGGTVTSSGKELTISGGTLNGNVAAAGGKLTVSGGTFNGNVTVSGASKLTITKGTTDEGAKFNGTVACSSSEAPSVTGGQLKNDPSDLLDKDHTAVKKDGASYYTISDDPNDIFATYTDDNGKEHSFNTIQQAIDYLSKYPQQDLSKPATIKLTQSVEENLTVGETQNIRLDLNGNDIKAKDNTKPVITSSGTLTVTDTNTDPNKAGSITGGSDGIVQEKGTLTVESKAKISGNTGSGIVQNNGTMTVSGNAEISSNGTGIVQNGGTMTIDGSAVISDNLTGIEQTEQDTFKPCSMKITGSTDITRNLTGVNKIKGDMSLEGNADIADNINKDLYLQNGEIVHVSDGFDGDVYVSTEKEPIRNNPVEITDNPNAVNSLKTKGEFCFFKETVSTDPFKEVVMMGVAVAQRNYEDDGKQVTKDYGKLQDALDEAGSDETVKLINDPDYDLEADALVIGKDKDGKAKELTLDLNGEFITGKAGGKTGITVNDGSKLTITDNSEPSAEDNQKHVGGVYGKLSTGTELKDENSAIILKDGLYGGMEREDYLPFIPGSYSLVENTDELTGEMYPFKVLYTPAQEPAEGYDAMVGTTDEGYKAVLEVNGDVATIYVVNSEGTKVQPKNVSLNRPCDLAAMGVKTVDFVLNDQLTLSVDLASVLQRPESGRLVIDFVDGIINVTYGGTVLLRADISDIADSVADLVYDGTSLKAYDANGNLLREFEI